MSPPGAVVGSQQREVMGPPEDAPGRESVHRGWAAAAVRPDGGEGPQGSGQELF